MNEYPVLFSEPMVRAILAHEKCQTRRLMPASQLANVKAGSVLWVREAWRSHADHGHLKPSDIPFGSDVDFKARGDGQEMPREGWYESRWRSPLHLPRHLAEIRLRVRSVAIERLGQINDETAAAEGAAPYKGGFSMLANMPSPAASMTGASAIEAFMLYWDFLHGKDSFAQAVYRRQEVMVLTFELMG